MEDSVALVAGPPTMELDWEWHQQQQQQQPELESERASVQLIVKHRLSQVRKDMKANVIVQPSHKCFL